jgi:hypothetical protein
MTLLVANLDCEVEWAGAPPLPAPVRARIAALGTLMRALAESDDDTIELPAAVDPARMPRVAGFPSPRLVERGAHVPHDSIIAWGGDAELGRRCNDRRLAHVIAAQRGVVPAGAAIVTSVEELEAHLPATTAASPTRAWVAKATICAAGRDRVRRRGAELDAATRIRCGRLLDRGSALILEPWLERTLDLGQPGEIAGGAVTLFPPHRLLCDDTGGFRGVVIGDAPEVTAHAAALAATGRAAGEALASLGYQGRFVVDAFVHRTPAGEVLRPLVEINARLTFGWIARAWSARLGPGTLEVGTGLAPPDAIALLLPAADDPTAAWFTPSSSRSPAR